MNRILFCLVALGITLPNLATAEDRSSDLIRRAESSKAGAHEVMSEFAGCAGYYQAMGEYGEQLQMPGSREISENLKKHASDAALVAVYFWAQHSEESIPAVWDIAEKTRQQYLTVLEGGRDPEAINKMAEECKTTVRLQVQIMTAMEKRYSAE